MSGEKLDLLTLRLRRSRGLRYSGTTSSAGASLAGAAAGAVGAAAAGVARFVDSLREEFAVILPAIAQQ